MRRAGGTADPISAHPEKRVPAPVHDGQLAAEQAAIALYFTDTFPEAGLGVTIGQNNRAEYLSWLAFYAASQRLMGDSEVRRIRSIAHERRILPLVPANHELLVTNALIPLHMRACGYVGVTELNLSVHSSPRVLLCSCPVG